MKKRELIPICMIVLFMIILLVYLYFCIIIPSPFWLKIFIFLFCITLLGVCVFVLKEKIKEIWRERRNDSGKY